MGGGGAVHKEFLFHTKMRKESHTDSFVTRRLNSWFRFIPGRLCVAAPEEAQLQISQLQQTNANFKFVYL